MRLPLSFFVLSSPKQKHPTVIPLATIRKSKPPPPPPSKNPIHHHHHQKTQSTNHHCKPQPKIKPITTTKSHLSNPNPNPNQPITKFWP